MQDYTDFITDMYVQEELDELEDIIKEQIKDNDAAHIILNKLDRVRYEFKVMYDRAYNVADSMDMINNELILLNKRLNYEHLYGRRIYQ